MVDGIFKNLSNKLFSYRPGTAFVEKYLLNYSKQSW